MVLTSLQPRTERSRHVIPSFGLKLGQCLAMLRLLRVVAVNYSLLRMSRIRDFLLFFFLLFFRRVATPQLEFRGFRLRVPTLMQRNSNT